MDSRTSPYGLRLSLDVAVGDPGHVVHVLNQRSGPVTIEWWGVMANRDAPRLVVSRIVPAHRVDSRALHGVADVNSARPLLQIDAGQFLYLRTVRVPEDVLTREQAMKWQAPTITDAERDALSPIMADQFYADEPLISRLPGGPKLVPFVKVPGVGYVFGKATTGPFTVLGGYVGYTCTGCQHDWVEHTRRGHRARRRLSVRAHQCTICPCPQFTGTPPPPPTHDQFR
ncbi:hypothetical protein [Pedococcus sp. P5_B7]